MTDISVPDNVHRPKPDVLRGLLVFGLTAGLGWIVASAQPFGPATRYRSSPEINGLLIAVAPLISAFAAYKPVRREAWAPRGLATSPEIGSPVFFCAWLLTALPVAIVFARGSSHTGEAIVFWLLVNVSWVLALEIQRRTRHLLSAHRAGEDSALHLNVEALAAGAFLGAAGLFAGEPRSACFAIAVGVTLTYLSATLRLSQRGVRRALIAWPVLIGGFAAAGYSSDLTGSLGLLVVAVSIPAIVERPRRALM